jgi:TfoX/Sxy family transcriptional regulator of competence genes
MAWKKVPPELVEFLDAAVIPYETERRSMFGSPVHFINNNMFAGAHEDNIMLRLRPEDQDELFVAQEEAMPFMPMGRRMKEYVLLPAVLYNDEAVFEEWLKRSHDFVSSLPPKEKKASKKRKKKTTEQ